MEQLLIFKSDGRQLEKGRPPSNENLAPTFDNGFKLACSFKNHQMQEFDKWKTENDWEYYPKWEGGKYGNPTIGFLSFSELFEVFEKERSKYVK